MIVPRFIAIAVASAAVSFLPHAALAQGESSHNAVPPKKYVSVAVVPYVEHPTERMRALINEIVGSLDSQKGIHALDYGRTQGILAYYLQYVDTSSRNEEAAATLQGARDAYLSLDYKRSRELIESTEGRIRDKMKKGEGNDLLVDALILKAKLAHVLGAKGDVEPIYAEIVRLNPELIYPAGLYSKWELVALQQAKDRLAAMSGASVEITVEPKNSEVYLNGIHKGTSYYDRPFIIRDVPPGRHCIAIKTVNYVPYTDCFDLGEGEAKTVRATLKRDSPSNTSEVASIRPERFKTPYELSTLVSGLGYYLAADKVVLVHEQNPETPGYIDYQIGDVKLGAVSKTQHIAYDPKNSPLALVTKEMRGDVFKDVLANPGDTLISQGVGSMQLLEKRKTPIYKRPLFWILVGAGAAGGGAAAAVLGVGGAVAATGGVIIGL